MTANWIILVLTLFYVEISAWAPYIHADMAEAIFAGDERINSLMKGLFPEVGWDGSNLVNTDGWRDEDYWEEETSSQAGQWDNIMNMKFFLNKYCPYSPNIVSRKKDDRSWFWSKSNDASLDYLRILTYNSQDVSTPLNHSPANEVWAENFPKMDEIDVENGLVDPDYHIEWEHLSRNVLVDQPEKYTSFDIYYDEYLEIHKNKTKELAREALEADLESIYWDEDEFRYRGVDNGLILSSFMMHTYLYLEKYGWSKPFSYINVNAEEVFRWKITYLDDVYELVRDTEDCPEGFERGEYIDDDAYFGYINTHNCKKIIENYRPKSLKVRSFGTTEINKNDGEMMILETGDRLKIVADKKIIINKGFYAKRGCELHLIKTKSK